MISKAISMIRSLRSSEMHAEREKEDVCSDLRYTMHEISSDSSVMNDNLTASSRVDNVNDSVLIQHELNSIQPRASIRSREIETECSRQITEKLVKRTVHSNAVQHTELDDSSVIIFDETQPKHKIFVNKSSRSQSIASQKELLCVDDEEPGPLVIDLDYSLRSSDHSSGSEASYHTSPQEVFDLCGQEPEVHNINKFKKPQEKNYDVIEANQATARTKMVECEKKEISTSQTLHKSKPKTVEDEILRLRLPLRGKNKKKLFTLRTSQLIALVSNKYHPLHKWWNLITLENINTLSYSEKKRLVKILVGFLEVEVINVKS